MNTVRLRAQTGQCRNDLIDLIIEAMTSDLSKEMETNEHASDQFEKDAVLADKKKKKKVGTDLGELDIMATAMAMLAAAYDNTSHTLTFVG